MIRTRLHTTMAVIAAMFGFIALAGGDPINYRVELQFVTDQMIILRTTIVRPRIGWFDADAIILTDPDEIMQALLNTSAYEFSIDEEGRCVDDIIEALDAADWDVTLCLRSAICSTSAFNQYGYLFTYRERS